MMTKILTLMLALLTLAVPATVQAYVGPEEVLLNRELFLPPNARDADDRAELQADESAARREREQERAFELQHPVVAEEEPEEEPTHASAPTAPPPGMIYAYPVPIGNFQFDQQLFGSAPSLDAANLELARTMRLLSRVNQNQGETVVVLPQNEVLHSGAGKLAPTGAGAILTAVTMLGALGFTLRKARNSAVILG